MQEKPRSPAAAPTIGRARSSLPLVAALIGLWAIIPPYFAAFGELTVRNGTVEFVDHAVPGLAVIAVAVAGYLSLRAAEPSQLVLFVGGLVILLAGFWMSATHYGLIAQYRQQTVPFGRMAWHGLPGLAVALLGVVWTGSFWDSDDEAEATSAS